MVAAFGVQMIGFLCIFLSLLLADNSSAFIDDSQSLRQIIHDLAWNSTSPYDNTVFEELEVNFTCNVKLKTHAKPESVHQLQPYDIDVIAALGDSITAGNALRAVNSEDIFTEYRGESWSTGGDGSLEDGVITLTNILRKFSPNIKGYPVGISKSDDEQAWFNAAVAGSEAIDVVEQADDLVSKMKNDARIDFQNDWKLTTILIGGNDMCTFCKRPDELNSTMFRKNLAETLDTLSENVPRMLVQLVVMFDITPLPEMSTGFFCNVVHRAVCSCALDDETRVDLRPLQLNYTEVLHSLAADPKYKREDFAVVVQPHFTDTAPPRTEEGRVDHSYFSLDCFHPSRKGHQAFALALWNTMLQKVGAKETNYTIDAHPIISCPTESEPFIWTEVNSIELPTPKPTNLPITSSGLASVDYIIIGVVGCAAVSVVCVGIFIAIANRRKERSGSQDEIIPPEEGNANDGFELKTE